jgi:hypothetical protein
VKNENNNDKPQTTNDKLKMPLGEDHINNYSAADIERYHKGLMPPAEMHAMEKAALEDPFLADAMEGYTYTDEASAEIEDIRLRLEKRVSKGARVVPMGNGKYNWLKAAAILVVIAGGATLAYLQMKQPAVNNNIAKQEPKAVTRPPNPAIEQLMDSMKKDTVMKARDIASVSSTANPYSKLTNTDSGLFANFNRNKELEDAGKRQSDDSNRSALFDKLISDSNEIAKTNNGYAQAETITPAAATQKDAAFKKAEADNQAISSEVLTNNNGFMKEAVIVSNRVTKKKEPVFTGKSDEYKQYRDSLNAGNYSVEDFLTKEAEPVIGWVAFNDYLRKNKRLYAVDSLEGNEVIVTFKVNAKGQLSNFRIETSVNEAYDAEAIRLIKEGPAWKLLKGKKAWIRVLVSF